MDDYIAALHDALVEFSGEGFVPAQQGVVGGSESSMSASTAPPLVRRKVAATKVKQTNFSPFEDTVLCKAWLEISCDPATNTGQRKEAFWNRVCSRYSSKCVGYPERSVRSIMSRWDHIKAEVGKFTSHMAQINRVNPSGMTDADKSVGAATNFASIEKHPFTLMHCWNVLKDEPKWNELKSRIDTLKNSASKDSSEHNSLNRDTDDPSQGTSSGKRPMGRDAAKAAKKKVAAASSEHVSKIHDLTIQKIELFKETEVERKARIDEMVTLEKVKFDEAREHRKMMVELERKRLAVDEKRLQMEAEKKEQEEEERIMAINLDECGPMQRLYYEARQEEIILKLQAKRRGLSQ
jgi:hypothetical protein